MNRTLLWASVLVVAAAVILGLAVGLRERESPVPARTLDPHPGDSSSPLPNATGGGKTSGEPTKGGGAGLPTSHEPNPPLPGATIESETLYERVWKMPNGGRAREVKFARSASEAEALITALANTMDVKEAHCALVSLLGGLDMSRSLRPGEAGADAGRIEDAIRWTVTTHPVEAVRAAVVEELLDSDRFADGLLEFAVKSLKSSPSETARKALTRALAHFVDARPLTLLKGDEKEKWEEERAKLVHGALRDMMEKDPSREVREEATRSYEARPKRRD